MCRCVLVFVLKFRGLVMFGIGLEIELYGNWSVILKVLLGLM